MAHTGKWLLHSLTAGVLVLWLLHNVFNTFNTLELQSEGVCVRTDPQLEQCKDQGRDLWTIITAIQPR